ncbi:hypothetical protein PCCS19_12420 [Paenibacillus sp. CCS19]|uniref:hypothetical protein n=1 Tax=Paenibacillus sp. CCS19 TaxID=3158387 RepID=UPI002566CC26|nr:hypothetical protein [Paenibacillus cellulosilyticus]GMK38188.1 hypothetical protein PCCS19_12420 [Paenibacillus cellulosilyticus]
MELVLVVIGLITFIIVLKAIGNQKPRMHNRTMSGRSRVSRPYTAPWPSEQPPGALGIAAGHPARSAAERLEDALSSDYEARVQYRVQSAKPGMTQSEWAWTWFELKRYFLMCALLRNVPMYSTKADEVWHEMLMFTREYESFCQQFCGAYIHHAPHGKDDNKPEDGSRAWFDWLYAELFEMSPVSGKVWGSFFREPLSRSRLSELESMSEQTIRSEWFRSDTAARYEDLDRTAAWLAASAKRQLETARRGSRGQGVPDYTKQSQSSYDGSGMMSASWLLLYFSAVEPNNLEHRMNEHIQRDNDRYGGSSACSSYSGDDSTRHGGSTHHGHSHHGHDHNDGGSSSCGGGGDSSCGGGGGCGGGGD